MSRTTFKFKEGNKERLLTISSHGYYQVFDKDVRGGVTWCLKGVKGEDGKWVWRKNPECKKSVLYEGECRHDLDLRLSDGEMEELAGKFFSEYLATTGRPGVFMRV